MYFYQANLNAPTQRGLKYTGHTTFGRHYLGVTRATISFEVLALKQVKEGSLFWQSLCTIAARVLLKEKAAGKLAVACSSAAPLPGQTILPSFHHSISSISSIADELENIC